MKAAGKAVEMKIYPPFGRSPQEGHSFGYFGAASWEQDVFGFLDRYCGDDPSRDLASRRG